MNPKKITRFEDLEPEQAVFLFKSMKWNKKLEKWTAKSKAVRLFIEKYKPQIISRPTLDRLIQKYPTGIGVKPHLIEPKWVAEYRGTDLHKALLRDYPDPFDPTKLEAFGMGIDTVGELLFLYKWNLPTVKGEHLDPATLPVEAFEDAFKWDIFTDEKRLRKEKIRKISFDRALALRAIMKYAKHRPDDYRWASTKELKRAPERDYLEENELIKYIYGINEIDTLELARLGFEGGGRFSATSAIRRKDVHFEYNKIALTETKTDKYPVKPFRPCTMDFVRRYLQDYEIMDKLFPHDYLEYESRFMEAGLRAGIFRYKTATESLEENEVVGKDGYVYETYRLLRKGKLTTGKRRVIVGKKTSSHKMKHTFVSLGSLHGLSLETLGSITATDTATLQKWYFGVGEKKAEAEIHGKIEYMPWWQWIDKVMDPHWNKRYNELKAGK